MVILNYKLPLGIIQEPVDKLTKAALVLNYKLDVIIA